MKIGVLCSRIRPEEKLLFKEIRKRGHVLLKIDTRELLFELDKVPSIDVDILLERCISHTHALYTTHILENRGYNIVNNYNVIRNCGDKIYTSILLEKNKVPTPRVRVAFTRESALKAIEELGYPVVLKPAVGSWGR